MKTLKGKIFAVLLTLLVGGNLIAGFMPGDDESVKIASRVANTVTLKAKSWNNGKVHLWHDVRGDSNTTFSDVADGASCTRIDSKTYKIGDGGPPIYYYKLNCNGSVGYVETDQTR